MKFSLIKKRTIVGFAAVCLFFGFTACNSDPDVSSKTRDIVLPPAEERETLEKNDILEKKYTGNCIVLMDGNEYGPYDETVKTGMSLSKKITFVSEKTVYSDMPVDFSYAFSDLKLIPDSDGKAFSFTGTGGELYAYVKRDNSKKMIPKKNTAVRGFFYKKGGNLYCSYIVEYNMSDIRDEFPLMPEDHKTMSSIVQDAVQQ